MGLPEPTLSFTIPSLHDDSVLDARIYHAKTSSENPFDLPTNRKRGAIIAHPYAPLGGSYDDPVVALVASQVLKEGFIVCTFNFRGAPGSKGHTSWTGFREREDYISIAGFLIHYLHNSTTQDSVELSQLPSGDTIQLILGGYSYGSLITSHLPESSEIVKIFHEPEEGTAIAEIKARAEHLAAQVNEEICASRKSIEDKASHHSSRRHGHTLSVGGEETSPEQRRHSTEGRLSSDLRKSLDLSRKLVSLRRKNRHAAVTVSAAQPDSDPPSLNIEASYLLISPLLPPISSLTTLPFGFRSLKHTNDELSKRLSHHHSLAVFGSDDLFTSAVKLRKWAKGISEESDSKFRYVEVEHAGHFWRNYEAQSKMKIAVKEWIGTWAKSEGGLSTIQSMDIR